MTLSSRGTLCNTNRMTTRRRKTINKKLRSVLFGQFVKREGLKGFISNNVQTQDLRTIFTIAL